MATKASLSKTTWFQIGLIGVFLCAPNAMIIKYTMGSVDPYLFNVIRFLLVALAMTPFIVANIAKFSGKRLMDSLRAGIFMAIAVTCYVVAIKLSQASYVSIIILISPVFLILFSARMNKEHISLRAAAGITIAAIGALVLVALPVVLHQKGAFVFYPLATLLALVNCAFFPLSIIYYRRANEDGIPMTALIGVTSWIVAAVNVVMMMLTGTQVESLSVISWVGIVYSGLVVSLLTRAINIVSYEHIGSVASSALSYIELFLSIMLPVIILHEQLSAEMVAGGCLILAGVYLVEHHKNAHHRHWFALKAH